DAVVHFRIANLKKSKSLHQEGLQPYVYSSLEQRWSAFACFDVEYSQAKRAKTE
ncbi:unnamed protein product, partial [Amoebophrya sp. A25]